MTKNKQTHESYILAIRDAVLEHRLGKNDRAKLEKTRMLYGRGEPGTRGTTTYELWVHEDDSVGDVIEICLHGEESYRQIMGTVLHEIGHSLAKIDAGHGPEWRDKCTMVGLVGAKAVATQYDDGGVFDPEFLKILESIPKPQDGKPGAGLRVFKGTTTGGCKAGQGTRGGKSRGKGSGSRNRKIYCAKCGYTARTTQRWIDVGLPTCPCGQYMQVKEDKTNHKKALPTEGD